MIERNIVSDFQILDLAARGGDVTQKDLMCHRYGYSKTTAHRRLANLVKLNLLEKLNGGVNRVIYLITEAGYSYWRERYVFHKAS